MKCEIQWIDEKGNVTPDDNEAIGVCWTIVHQIIRDDMSTHWIQQGKEYPICAEHAEQLKNNFANNMRLWAFRFLREDEK